MHPNNDESKMEKYYFTFGQNQVLHDNYVVIPANDRDDARRKMCAYYGKLWAFQYVWEEFKDQPAEYGLTEVKLGTPNFKRY